MARKSKALPTIPCAHKLNIFGALSAIFIVVSGMLFFIYQGSWTDVRNCSRGPEPDTTDMTPEEIAELPSYHPCGSDDTKKVLQAFSILGCIMFVSTIIGAVVIYFKYLRQMKPEGGTATS